MFYNFKYLIEQKKIYFRANLWIKPFLKYPSTLTCIVRTTLPFTFAAISSLRQRWKTWACSFDLFVHLLFATWNPIKLSPGSGFLNARHVSACWIPPENSFSFKIKVYVFNFFLLYFIEIQIEALSVPHCLSLLFLFYWFLRRFNCWREVDHR